MFGSIWGENKPYRATDMPLATEGDTVSEVSTEGGIEETNEVVSSEPVVSEDTKEDTPATEPEPAPEPVSSWWDYTASYTNKLKQSAQTLQQSAQQSAQTLQQSAQTLQQSAQQFDYNKLGEKIGETVNKEKVTSATNNLGSYFNSMYNGLKTSVETIQKEGIPMLSEFDEEQNKFVKMQQRRQGAAVPPWVGYNEEEKMKKQILSLSLDERNVLRDPPAGVDFVFDFESNMPVATAMLETDPKLNDLRFKLVPKVIKEDKFWRNYFYRVSLIKHSSQLASLDKSPTPEAVPEVALPSPGPDEPDYSFSPQDDEFISDHLSNYEDAAEEELVLNEDELKHLGLQKDGDKETETVTAADEEWEAELARELQDFDMVEDADGKLDTGDFEAELEEMLQNQ